MYRKCEYDQEGLRFSGLISQQSESLHVVHSPFITHLPPIPLNNIYPRLQARAS